MVDLGEFDARRPVPQSQDQQEGVFRRFRDRLEGLTKAGFGNASLVLGPSGRAYLGFKKPVDPSPSR